MVHQKELIPYLANLPLDKAFSCSKAEIAGLADVLVAKAEERLREAEVSTGEVNPHLYIEVAV